MAWPALVLKFAPYVLELAKIATTTLPHFTKRQAATPDKRDEVMAQQIAELQTAVTENAANIRTLAQESKDAMAAIDQGGGALEARIQRLERLCYGALGLSALSVLLLIGLWVR